MLLFFATVSFASEASYQKLEKLVGRQFHVKADHKFTFYDFAAKNKEHIITREQDITIKKLVIDKYGAFYELEFSRESYHYYADALLFYATVIGEDIEITNLAEAEQRIQEEARQREELERKALESSINKISSRLKPNYRGDEFQQLYVKSFASLLSKKEFEKTADYKKRLAAINLDRIYAFQFAAKQYFQITYNADTEMLEFNVDGLSIIEHKPKMLETIRSFLVLKTTNKKESSYIGSNAFGAKKVIRKYEANLYGLQVVKNSQSEYKMSLHMSPNEAKKYKDNLTVMIICRPFIKDDTLAFLGSSYAEPTFSAPIEVNDAVAGINVELLELWLYDLKSGKLLYKKKFWE